MSHRVAVVVRTKDRPGFLTRALGDISAQTYRDVEVIIVNDGDRSIVDAAVVAAGLDLPVEVLDSRAPGGRCAAANTGVSAADAEYVVLHDDDDLWHREFLGRTVGWLDEHPEAAGVSAATDIVYEAPAGDGWVTTSRVPFWAHMQHISLNELLRINRIVPISFLYRKALHDEFGEYDESLDAAEDWEFYLRFLPTRPIGFISGPALAYWTQRPDIRGADGNSVFELLAEHNRDDAIVRDRALSEWISLHGAGIPLHIGAVERRTLEAIEASEERTRVLLEEIRREIAAHHPFWSRVRRGVRRIRSKRQKEE